MWASLTLLWGVVGQVVYVHDALPVSGQTPADGYEIPHLLAAVSGIVNRNASTFYYLWGRSDQAWLARSQTSWLANHSLVNLTAIEDVVKAFLPFFQGIVLYDPAVPQTSLVASTAAGHDSLLPLCYRPSDPTSLYARISPLLPVRLNLVGLFNGSVSGSAKVDAILWAKARYLDSATGPVNLAYYLDYYWTREAGNPYVLNTVGNHDYFIARKAFFFDLSPWADEAPNDDPHQPLGTDQAALKAIFLAAYTAAKGDFIHLGGFPPWAYKYVAPYGKHQGVETEWYFARIASGFNVYMDADACCVHDFANAAFYQHYPLKPTYSQNKGTYSLTDLQRLGYIDSQGKVVPKHYYMFYVGDYDSASWVYNMMWDFWHDPARGKIPLGWALDPNLADRFPIMFDIMLSSLSPNDRLIAGDSGAGYINPDALISSTNCRQSGLPSAANTWIKYNAPLYQRFAYNFTGFLINGDCGDLSPEAEAMYQSFSSAGVVAQTGTPHMTGSLPVLVHDSDLPANVEQAVAVMLPILKAAKPTSFHVFRTILVSPSYHVQVHDAVLQQQPDGECVDPVILAALLSYSLA